jgi:hypothetical protein
MLDTPQANEDTTSNTNEPSGSEHPNRAVAPPHAPKWHPDEQKHHSYERKYWAIIAILTGIAAVGAIASTILALQALRSSQESVGAARDAVKEANRQAKAAEDQVIISQDIAKRQLRAYVFVDKARITLDGNILRGSVDVRNAGQTPAYDLTTKSGIQTQEVQKPFDALPFENVELSRTILGPNGIIRPHAELIVPPDNTVAIPAFREGRGIIYYSGQVEYRDAFDRVWVLDFRLRSSSFDGKIWTLQPTEDGNKETQKQ